jgi:hypothetical protein
LEFPLIFIIKIGDKDIEGIELLKCSERFKDYKIEGVEVSVSPSTLKYETVCKCIASGAYNFDVSLIRIIAANTKNNERQNETMSALQVLQPIIISNKTLSGNKEEIETIYPSISSKQFIQNQVDCYCNFKVNSLTGFKIEKAYANSVITVRLYPKNKIKFGI